MRKLKDGIQKDKTGFNILEMSNADKVTGRTIVKFVIHEIFDSPDKFNKNGISWNEQYTRSNIESANGMPLCVEFLDYDKSEPFGHGLSGLEGDEPLFEYSTMVGVIEKADIENVTLPDGRAIRALTGTGYINAQRYPNFVQWLKAQMYDGKPVESSVEISKKTGNKVILYDGGWKEEGRVPQFYDYTGHAILGVEPSDSTAVLLELNSSRKKKEEKSVDEKEKQLLELNTKLEAKNDKITELNDMVREQEGKITELNAKAEGNQSEINMLTTEKVAAEAQVTELNEKIGGMEAELNSLRQFKVEADNKSLVAELNTALSGFTEEEVAPFQAKVEACSAAPSTEGITALVSEINSAIVAALKDQRNKTHEQNNNQGDILFSMHESNSKNNVNNLEQPEIDGLY